MSEQTVYAPLAERVVVKVSGPDRRDFLQGIVSNDVRLVGPERAIHTGFLTPQGKFLHDFFIAALPADHPEADELGGPWLLDCAAPRIDQLLKRLKVYKLRSKVTLAKQGEAVSVAAAWGADAAAQLGLSDSPGAATGFVGGTAFVDPRGPGLGVRVLAPADDAAAALAERGLAEAGPEAYDRHRVAQGVPDGEADAQIEKSNLLELGFDEIGSIAWDKGCYLGQELTARTRYRGLLKRRLYRVRVDGPAPEPGTSITSGAKTVGDVRSVAGGYGLALLRIDAAEADGAQLAAGEATITPLPASSPAGPDATAAAES